MPPARLAGAGGRLALWNSSGGGSPSGSGAPSLALVASCCSGAASSTLCWHAAAAAPPLQLHLSAAGCCVRFRRPAPDAAEEVWREQPLGQGRPIAGAGVGTGRHASQRRALAGQRGLQHARHALGRHLADLRTCQGFSRHSSVRKEAWMAPPQYVCLQHARRALGGHLADLHPPQMLKVATAFRPGPHRLAQQQPGDCTGEHLKVRALHLGLSETMDTAPWSAADTCRCSRKWSHRADPLQPSPDSLKTPPAAAGGSGHTERQAPRSPAARWRRRPALRVCSGCSACACRACCSCCAWSLC